MQDQPTRRPLKRLARTEYEDQPRYLHPHGYVIERSRRTWSERGRTPGRKHDPPPALHWWTVYHHIARRRSMLEGKRPVFLTVVSDKYYPKDFGTLAEARAWCDENPREGWL